MRVIIKKRPLKVGTAFFCINLLLEFLNLLLYGFEIINFFSLYLDLLH